MLIVKYTIATICLVPLGSLKFLYSGQSDCYSNSKKNILLNVMGKEFIYKEQEPVPSATRYIEMYLLS